MFHYKQLKNLCIWSIMIVAAIIAMPNFLPHKILSYLPQFYAHLHLPLGVDLQGGSRLVVALPTDVKGQSNGEINSEAQINSIDKRLQALLVDDNDYIIKKQWKSENSPTRQIKIEVPHYFDSDTLKNIVTVAAHFTVHQQDTTMLASDILTKSVKIPDGSKIGYTLEDPPNAVLIKAKALWNNDDIFKITIEPQPHEQALLHIALKPESLQKTHQQLDNIDKLPLIVLFDDDILAEIDYAFIQNTGQIEIGPFALDIAQNLQIVLSASPLLTDLTVLEERTIGSDLGQANTGASLLAVFAAFAIVAVFMVIIYGVWGIIANIALLAHLFLLISILVLFDISLSLSGFAGLVLVIGISVDAIILIFERIKEARKNINNGADIVKIGFSGAIHTIFDANMTVIIAALALLLLGGAVIQGFAIVVTIGMITSFFTSVSFTPVLISFFGQFFHLQPIKRNPFGVFWKKSSIHFMFLGKFTLSLALVLSIITAALYFTAGMNYGIDFVGGSFVVLEKKQGDSDLYDIRERANAQNIGGVTVAPTLKANQALMIIASQNLGENAEQSVAIKLNNAFSDDYRLEQVDVVGATISNALSFASVVAILTAFMAIFAYIYWRFSFFFALGALITTMHDIIIMFLIFLILQWQFNIWSIAAILAIIGYSLNDTIVVYDRIRSLVKSNKTMPMADLVDLAINKTLSRTILTSTASFLAHIPLYYFNRADIKDFAFQLLLGIVIGTYSSIFIAGPLLVLLGAKPKALKSKNALKEMA